MSRFRRLLERALPTAPREPLRVALERGTVTEPGMVRRALDRQPVPVDGPALSGAGAVLTVDGHHVFLPYEPVMDPRLTETVEQVAEQQTSTQESVNAVQENVVAVAESVDAQVDEVRAIANDAVLQAASAVGATVLPTSAGLPTSINGRPPRQGDLLYRTDAAGLIEQVRIHNGSSWISYSIAADHILATGSITGNLFAGDAFVGRTFTGNTFRTSEWIDLYGGLIMDADGLRGYTDSVIGDSRLSINIDPNLGVFIYGGTLTGGWVRTGDPGSARVEMSGSQNALVTYDSSDTILSRLSASTLRFYRPGSGASVGYMHSDSSGDLNVTADGSGADLHLSASGSVTVNGMPLGQMQSGSAPMNISASTTQGTLVGRITVTFPTAFTGSSAPRVTCTARGTATTLDHISTRIESADNSGFVVRAYVTGTSTIALTNVPIDWIAAK